MGVEAAGSAAAASAAPGHVDLLFAGSVFCDLVFAGMPMPEPGTEVYARAFRLTRPALVALPVRLPEPGDRLADR